MILLIPNSDTIHIWKVYIDDFYDTSLDGKVWIGFTGDYYLMVGIFSNGTVQQKLL